MLDITRLSAAFVLGHQVLGSEYFASPDDKVPHPLRAAKEDLHVYPQDKSIQSIRPFRFSFRLIAGYSQA